MQGCPILVLTQEHGGKEVEYKGLTRINEELKKLNNKVRSRELQVSVFTYAAQLHNTQAIYG